jgi:hypothetical protein
MSIKDRLKALREKNERTLSQSAATLLRYERETGTPAEHLAEFTAWQATKTAAAKGQESGLFRNDDEIRQGRENALARLLAEIKRQRETGGEV